jgi:hypothetical protein
MKIGTEKLMFVEVKRHHKLPALTNELKESIAALKHHPGMQYLLAKHAMIAAQIQKQLNESKHSDLSEVIGLQHGLFWAQWLETEVMADRQFSTEATPQEMDLWSKVRKDLEVLTPQG